MYCTHCGNNMEDNPVCPRCGRPAGEGPFTSAPESVNPAPILAEEESGLLNQKAAVRRVLAEALSSPLLLAIGILLLVGPALTILTLGQVGGSYLALSVLISILDGIAVLLVVAAAKKAGEQYLGENGAFLRGMLKAHYVIGWVAFGFCLLGTLVLVLCRTYLLPVLDEYMYAFQDYGYGLIGLSYGGPASGYDTMLLVLFWVLIGILLLAALAALLETLFFFGKLVRMGKDIHTSLLNGEFCVRGVRAVRGWSMALFVLTVLSALTTGSMLGILTMLTVASEAAAYLLLFLWTGKYFIPKNL